MKAGHVGAKTKQISMEMVKMLQFPLPLSLAGEEDVSACSTVWQSQAFCCSLSDHFLYFFFSPIFDKLAARLWSHVLFEVKAGISIPFDFLYLIQNLSHVLLFILLNFCRFSYVDLLTSLPCHQNIIYIASAPLCLVLSETALVWQAWK